MILLRGGTLLSATGARRADVLVGGEKVVAVGPELDRSNGAAVVDVGGALLLPGGIDPHVHFHLGLGGGLFSRDDFDSGSRAALLGGTTTVIDFVTPDRGEPLDGALERRFAETRPAWCDFALHQSITWWDDGTAAEMREMADREGIPSFKVYMAYRETVGIDDDTLLAVMAAAAENELLILCHCEDAVAIDYLRNRLHAQGRRGAEWHPKSRPPVTEATAVARACAYAQMTGARLHVVHVSTAAACAAIEEARRAGARVTGEACLHHLVLTESLYEAGGLEAAKFVMSPPLRSAEDRDALWLALERGVLDEIATDHCSFDLRGQKDRHLDDFRLIPNGVPGVAHRMPLLYQRGVVEGRIDPWSWVALTAENAARLFGLYPRKGTIAPGGDADIVIWDPSASATIGASGAPHACDYSPYSGMRIRGAPRKTYLRGRLTADDGSIVAPAAEGRFLRRALGSRRPPPRSRQQSRNRRSSRRTSHGEGS